MSFNQLSSAKAERFTMLAEEANEISHIICKILRHGLKSFHPDDPLRITNMDLLNKELGDLAAVLYIMGLAGDFDDIVIPDDDEIINVIVPKKLKYTHHQDD